MTTTIRLTTAQRRSIDCPNCSARKGSPCRSNRIASHNTLGGGWGGHVSIDREHRERADAVRASLAATAA